MSAAAAMAAPRQAAPLRHDDAAAIVYADAKAAFAGMRINAYIPDASLAKTIGEFMSIPGAETPAQFGADAMIDGCRRHSCIEKAAVIVDMRTRKILAVTLRNFECQYSVLDDSEIAAMARGTASKPLVRCNDEPILDVYVVRRSLRPDALQAEREQLARLRQWGREVGSVGERVQVIVRYAARP
ncbi:hypothetical protein [Massilia soli]|uniref:Uncharacterized protein n=1 Tax=Massilia soli TaxID=2792854 RepID=A0ABS7SUQ0_9BURK|nr:hypothetical protein [Massilia soli]MBZ2209654.1 hypothetical protein [Massilia soli]